MADTKISALATLLGSAVVGADLLPIVDTTDVSMAASGTDKKITVTELVKALFPVGLQLPCAGRTPPGPAGFFLFEAGQAVSRATYAALFAYCCPTIGTVTITNANPGVGTITAHGLNEGDAFYLTTTGTLPTGLTPNTIYYAKGVATHTLQFAATRTATAAGAAIATSSAGSGVHTLVFCPYGLGDGSTTFNVPDRRGKTSTGADAMGVGGADGGVLDTLNALGLVLGEQYHTLTVAELAGHNHTLTDPGHAHYAGPSTYYVTTTAGGAVYAGGIGGSYQANTGLGNTGITIAAAGGDTPHNNKEPTMLDNWCIKT